MKVIRFSLITTLIASFPSTLIAATIHVPADQPTIQAGIDASIDGDLVLVAPGTYVENIDFLGKTITVRSEGGAGATAIDGSRWGCVVTFSSGENEASILDGFQIRNGAQNDGGGIVIMDSAPTIRNCRIQDNGAGEHGGGIYCANSDPMIINCTISDNHVSQDIGTGNAMYCTHSSPRLKNCIITENFPVTSIFTIIFYESCNPVFTNCTIFGNSPGAGSGIVLIEHCTARITNCIIWEDFPLSLGAALSTATVSYSDIKGGRFKVGVCLACTLNWLEGNIAADPRFVDIGNCHLLPWSRCIDAGTDVGVYEDIDGDPRPQGGGFDMGAYEAAISCFIGLVIGAKGEDHE